MFKRTILWMSLAGITAGSVVLVAAVIQAPPRREGGTSSSGGVSPRDTAAAADRAAEQTRPEDSQGVGLEDIQARIRASDEEWKVIGPKLRRLMMAYAAAEVSFDESTLDGTDDPGFAPPGRGGPGGPGGGPGGPGKDSFSSPADAGPFDRGGGSPIAMNRDWEPGPGPGGFGRGGPGPGRFGPGGPGPDGFGPGPGGFGRGGRGRGGFGGMPPFGGPPGFGGPGGNAVTQKLAELRTALADPNTTPAQLQEKLGVVRDARVKAKAELAAARKDLLELLTPDQEAVLVSLNYLD